jgi:hypothetical protein
VRFPRPRECILKDFYSKSESNSIPGRKYGAIFKNTQIFRLVDIKKFLNYFAFFHLMTAALVAKFRGNHKIV